MQKSLIIAVSASILTLVMTLILLEFKAQNDQLIVDEVLEIESTILEERRKILIHLPKNYNQNKLKSYPVIYALDGTTHDQYLVNSATVLNSAGVMPEVIIVGIPNTDRNRDLTPTDTYQNADSNDKGEANQFTLFMKEELIPNIDSKYRTNEYRIISGNSRAGLFVFNVMVKDPNLFNTYFAFSPAMWRASEKFYDLLKIRLLADISQNKNHILFTSIGENENEKMRDGFSRVLDTMMKYPNPSIKVKHIITPDEDHSSNAYRSNPAALIFWAEEYQKQ